MRNLTVLILVFSTFSLHAQVVGGRAAFDFLNIPSNAHLAGLAGVNVSVVDKDPMLSLANPALLNSKMSKRLSINYVPYIADIKSYAMAGAYDIKKIGPLSVSIKYLNYGSLDERLDDATYVGTFQSADYALTVGKSYTIGVMTLGVNAKYLHSKIGTYTSDAFAVDAGALFRHPKEDFTIGMAIKNLGKVSRKYTPTSKDSLPFDVQIGSSYKFKHAPIRVSLTAFHLNRWDNVYNDPNQTTKVDESGNPIRKKVYNAERLLRHLVFAIEIMPSKYFHLRAGYNYLMSRELSLTDGISSAGLSFGGNVRLSFLEAGYTHTIIHKAGGMHTFTLNLDLGKINDFYSRN